MMVFKLSALLSCMVACSYAAIAPGQNAYLPPKDSGYNYNKPQQPFPSPPGPSRPTPFQPKPNLPSPQPPRPFNPQPSRPPAPQTTYGPPGRPQTPAPTYGPPGRPQGPPPGPNYVGQPSGPTGQHADHDHHHHEPGMPFDFNYAVKDDQYGNDYSHNAVSDGDVTKGEYRIQLPDGRTQIVKYTADWKTGFHAQVKFEGTPTYPQFQGRPSNQVGYPSGPARPSGPAPPGPSYPSGPSRPSGPSPGYPSGPARPSQPSFPSGPSRPSQPGYPSGPRPSPSFPSPSKPSFPSQPGYPSGPKPTPSFPSPSRPNQIPGQQYTPGGGYKY